MRSRSRPNPNRSSRRRHRENVCILSSLIPPDNGGHKMTAVSKEIQPLDNVLLTGGAQKSLGISNLAPRGKMWNGQPPCQR